MMSNSATAQVDEPEGCSDFLVLNVLERVTIFLGEQHKGRHASLQRDASASPLSNAHSITRRMSERLLIFEALGE